MSSVFMGSVRLANIKVWDTGEIIDIIAQTRHSHLIGETIDCTGVTVTPGLVDMHVHFFDPGNTQREDIRSGSAAASAGGFTDVAMMPDTLPAADGEPFMEGQASREELIGQGFSSVLDYWQRYADSFDPNQPIDYCMVAAATVDRQGRRVSRERMWERFLRGSDSVKRYGHPVVALSDDPRAISERMLDRVMELAHVNDLVVMDHCENHTSGMINEGELSRRLGVPGIPDSAEIDVIRRDIEACRRTGARLHLQHVTTAGGFDLIREAKQEGLPVTCETAPHYFALTDKDVERYGAYAKVNPPLRSAADRLATLEAIADGTVDAIATDHTPLTLADRQVHALSALDGISGLETSYALAHTLLVTTGVIGDRRLVELMSLGPAQILGLNRNRISMMLTEDPALAAQESLKALATRVTVNPEASETSDFDQIAASSQSAGQKAHRVLDLTDGRHQHVRLSLVAPKQKWNIDTRRFFSNGHNSPFNGWKVHGMPIATIMGSRLHDVAQHIRNKEAHGRWNI